LIIDQDRFFREIAIRICGSLDIEKALWSCLQFLRGVIPVDEVQMDTYDRQTGSMRLVAIADMSGGRLESYSVRLPSHLRDEIENVARYPKVRWAHSSEDRFSSFIDRTPGAKDSSVLINRLTVEGAYIGSFIARVFGRNKYTDEHVRLWELVNEPAAIALANSQRYRAVLGLKDLLIDDKTYLEKELRKNYGGKVIGADQGLRGVMEKVRMVAGMNSPVLLTGETGAGKEVIANAIHDSSNRCNGPFIKMNCGAIPDTLIDSELFGHEKGAFTGATSEKRGRFERANGGTIFLDEISELPLQAQVRFLRVLQEKEFERVGGTKPLKVDVRVLSATSKNLEDLIAKGLFREDLYFRLNVFPIAIPALRERRLDIPALVHHFIRSKAREMGFENPPPLPPGTIEKLTRYNWPGNVRELENVVERAIILSEGKTLVFHGIIDDGTNKGRAVSGRAPREAASLHDVEADHIRQVLRQAGGKVSGKGGAAELLQINPGTLRARMRKLGIPFGRKVPV
jgi:transcriptional regulator with GAF, ATPase, and Fis domain